MIRIFVEGKDEDFIKVYIEYLKGKNLIDENKEYQIRRVRGYTNLVNTTAQFKENTDAGGINLLIFDADSEYNDGGYLSRKKYLEKQKSDLGITFYEFLLPNDENSGNFETLLENIIHEEHKCLLDCFVNYETCLGQYKNDNNTNKYKLPVQKSKIYAYVDAFPKSRKESKKFKEGDFFFNPEKYWNLDAEYLEPLKFFLLQNFK